MKGLEKLFSCDVYLINENGQRKVYNIISSYHYKINRQYNIIEQNKTGKYVSFDNSEIGLDKKMKTIYNVEKRKITNERRVCYE